MSDVVFTDGDVIFEDGDVIFESLSAKAIAYKHVLEKLFPIELGDTFDKDIEIEGKYLGQADDPAGVLLENVFPDTADDLLQDWERVLDITPDAGASTYERQNACVAKLREYGGLSIPYFTQLALDNGYVIEIEEFKPFQTGIGQMGDRMYVPEIIFYWQVNVISESSPVVSHAALEARFQDLKPADTYVAFVWP